MLLCRRSGHDGWASASRVVGPGAEASKSARRPGCCELTPWSSRRPSLRASARHWTGHLFRSLLTLADGKTDLPREVRQEPLNDEQLVSTLELIDGETVIVRLASREADNANTAGMASIVGELRHQTPARYEGHEFSIGTPYPDRDAEHLAGGILFIREATFEDATLSTFDGNDYFIIAIRTRRVEIIVQDGGSTYP